ncbi:MAG: alpha/beta hydrolase [Actinomycetes bacterium]
MPVDPNFQALLDNLAGPDAKDLADLTIGEARDLEVLMGMLESDKVHVDSVEDRTIPGPAGEIPIRVYHPDARGSRPGILLWFHGGGWCLGNLQSGDGPARQLASSSGAVVVSVEYRLAPEHPFPAGPEDCWAALNWVANHGSELGGDPARIAVGGDSAGGNLAAVVAIKARDAGAPFICHQLLVYPGTDLTMSHPSIEENAEGFLLTKRSMIWFADLYLGPDGDPRDPEASPIFADDLSGVAPATVITAMFDPLRDEGEAYAEALRQAGVEARTERYDTMIHGFFSMGSISPIADHAINDAAAILREALVD